jgi:hypothetical protein
MLTRVVTSTLTMILLIVRYLIIFVEARKGVS